MDINLMKQLCFPQLNDHMVTKLPNLRCFITGNFPMTSAINIFDSPDVTLFHVGTPLMSFKSGELSPNGTPFFI